ncbi:MAG: NAD(P)H-dependent oxidoreductase [Candidatus Freyarchaeum deiterrae]
MANQISILGFAGSLRKGSYNKALLRAAMEVLPKDAKLEIFDLEGIPPFNQDFENNPPQKVKDFKAKIKAADALLIATPEYNYSVSGVLKNAIDAASRPFGDNPFNDKPVGILSASIGPFGAAKAQYHLRQICVTLNMHPMNAPEFFLTNATEKFDDKGKLKDQQTREILKLVLQYLVNWTRRLKGNAD